MEIALPNLHPAVVHFPVVLIPLALVLDLAWWARREDSTSRLGALIWCLAAVTAILAFIAGRSAADGLVGVPPLVQPAIGAHSDWASATVGLSLAVALSRVAVELRRGAGWSLVVRGLSSLLAICLGGVVFITADKGGALVYQHALAVASPECEVCEQPAPAPSSPAEQAPLLVRDGAQWVWSPEPSHAGELRAVPWPKRGAAFQITDTQTLTFEPELGDVQINAWLDLTGFDGEVLLLHHFDGEAGGAFTVATTGAARLLDLSPEPTELDAATIDLTGRHAFAVNAAGGHLKGMVDGQMVVHGHAPPRAAGKVALRFEGSGVVGVERVEFIPLEGH